jgi:hypothetical protein
MDASNTSTTNGVYLANFPLATEDLLRAIEHSGSVEQASSDDAGDYYAMAMASVKPAEEVMESAIIVIPLTRSFGSYLRSGIGLHVFPTAPSPAAEVYVRPLRCLLGRRASSTSGGRGCFEVSFHHQPCGGKAGVSGFSTSNTWNGHGLTAAANSRVG